MLVGWLLFASGRLFLAVVVVAAVGQRLLSGLSVVPWLLDVGRLVVVCQQSVVAS